jgi:hypothetical protein
MRKNHFTSLLLACTLLFIQSKAQEISQLSFYSPLISTFDMKYTNNHLAVSQNGLLIFDVSNPAKKPELIAKTTYPGSTAYALGVQGVYAYMALGNNGIFAVYDISGFSSPTLKGSVAIAATSFYGAGDVQPHGNYIYVTGFDSLYVINVSNPTAPALVNAIAVEHTDFSGAEDMAIDGSTLFIKTPFSILAYDVTNPTAPSLNSSISYLHTYNHQLAVDTINHRLFLSWATALQDFTGYDAFNVSNPSAPTYLFSDSTDFSSGDFGIMDYSYFNNVLFTSKGGSINAFDVSATHHFVTTFSGENIPNASVSIQVRDSVLFHARGGGIEVLKYGGAPVPVCDAPKNLKQVVTGTTAYLYWNKVSGARGYVIKYRAIGTNNWKVIPTKDNVQQLNNLESGTAYTWQVKAVCNVTPLKASDWSLYNVFYVKNEALISASPNPANNFIRIHVHDAAIKQIAITDLRGKLLIKAKMQSTENNISVAALQTGTYILQGMDKNNNVIAAIKIFKQ